MKAYQDLCRNILRKGETRPNRTGVPVIGMLGDMDFVHDLQTGFPLLTTKQMNIRPIEAELIGFLTGKTSAADFRKLGTKIWDENANKTQSWVNNPYRKGEDDLGPFYSEQWRRYESIEIAEYSHNDDKLVQALKADGYEYLCNFDRDGKHYQVLRKYIDQLQNLIDGLKADPYGRRHIVSAWNPGKLNKVALPACHAMFQCYVRAGGYLDMKMYQRSADTLLGIPFNIASYAMLVHLLAMLTDLKPGKLMISFGDIHIYENHLPQIWEQTHRAPKKLPELTVRRVNSLDEVEVGMFQLHGYHDPHPALPGKMAG